MELSNAFQTSKDKFVKTEGNLLLFACALWDEYKTYCIHISKCKDKVNGWYIYKRQDVTE